MLTLRGPRQRNPDTGYQANCDTSGSPSRESGVQFRYYAHWARGDRLIYAFHSVDSSVEQCFFPGSRGPFAGSIPHSSRWSGAITSECAVFISIRSGRAVPPTVSERCGAAGCGQTTWRNWFERRPMKESGRPIERGGSDDSGENLSKTDLARRISLVISCCRPRIRSCAVHVTVTWLTTRHTHL